MTLLKPMPVECQNFVRYFCNPFNFICIIHFSIQEPRIINGETEQNKLTFGWHISYVCLLNSWRSIYNIVLNNHLKSLWIPFLFFAWNVYVVRFAIRNSQVLWEETMHLLVFHGHINIIKKSINHFRCCYTIHHNYQKKKNI